MKTAKNNIRLNGDWSKNLQNNVFGQNIFEQKFFEQNIIHTDFYQLISVITKYHYYIYDQLFYISNCIVHI